ncbi:MAG: hypothetical protein H7X88_11310 [Gloeobacteraceae cyanobacterium ES-bin-316]|nr:hypothetical protein [Ferruginibacter sp.]
MQLKKEILLFYILILVSAGIIIAAEQPNADLPKKPVIKCSKATQSSPSAAPSNTITEGLLRYKA